VRPRRAGTAPVDCAATVVIATPNANAIVGFLLIALGALLSLGFQMAYDGWFRRR
jgi:hypothetical protein